MKIAILGWGSLIWDPRDLQLIDNFKYGGPELPLEFSRISNTRNGALTLVIDQVHGTKNKTYYAISTLSTLNEAKVNLSQ